MQSYNKRGTENKRNRALKSDVEITLEKAVQLNRRVKIIYERNGEYTERVVRPHGLTEIELIGYCYLRKARRKFKISNILSAILLDS